MLSAPDVHDEEWTNVYAAANLSAVEFDRQLRTAIEELQMKVIEMESAGVSWTVLAVALLRNAAIWAASRAGVGSLQPLFSLEADFLEQVAGEDASEPFDRLKRYIALLKTREAAQGQP
jgi:hypothetical protein